MGLVRCGKIAVLEVACWRDTSASVLPQRRVCVPSFVSLVDDGLPKREVRQDNHSSHHPELAAGFKRRGRRGPCLATEGVSGRIAGVSSLRAKSSTLVASTTPQTGAATAAEMPADNLWLTVGSTVASGGVIACLLVGAYKREHRLSVDRRKDSIDYLMSDGDLSEDEK